MSGGVFAKPGDDIDDSRHQRADRPIMIVNIISQITENYTSLSEDNDN